MSPLQALKLSELRAKCKEVRWAARPSLASHADITRLIQARNRQQFQTLQS